MKIYLMFYKRMNNDIYFKHFLKNPCLYQQFILLFLTKILNVGKKYIKFFNWSYNTKERRRILNEIKNSNYHKIKNIENITLPKLNLDLAGKYLNANNIQLPLATCYSKLDKSIFNKNYKDKEDYFAANRFIWLYSILVHYPYENILQESIDIIIGWISENQHPSKELKFESYSISERIIAWIFYLIFIKNHIKINNDFINKIFNSIELQLNYLMNHLEYRGNKTNNHILNNARALYIVGRLLKIGQAELLGKKIIKIEYDKIFKEGVYQEGSSHYQFLITKNFLEIFMVADYSQDYKYKEELYPILIKMLYVSNKLQSKYNKKEFPLIGDISPDMEPDWFIGKPFSNQTNVDSRWYKLFKYDVHKKVADQNTNKIPLSKKSNINWLYLAKDGFEVWINARKGGIPCHGHNDNGAIVLYYRGNPIIIDLGLASYSDKTNRIKQEGHEAHNIPIINQYPVDIPKESKVYNSKINSSCEIEEIKDNGISYLLTYANKKIKIRRNITIINNVCKIKDEVKINYKIKEYEIKWHLNGKVKETYKDQFEMSNLTLHFACNENFSYKVKEEFYKSSKYGSNSKINTIYLKAGLNTNQIELKIYPT